MRKTTASAQPANAAEALNALSADAALIAASAQGDSMAYALLVQRYLQPMLALAQRLLGNAADADEVAQEAFLRLWQNAARWDAEGKASLRTWLGRVTTNLCLDRLRRKKAVSLDEAEEIEDDRPAADQLAEQRDRKQAVQEALMELPARQRIATVLSYYEEMSMNDIARTMELTVGAVESLLVRARRNLRTSLKGFELEGEDA